MNVGVLIIFGVIYTVLQVLLFIVGLMEASMEFDYSGHNVDLVTAKNIYKNSNYNWSYCKVLSFIKNLFGFSYNIGIITYAIFYYLTRKGRNGRFE